MSRRALIFGREQTYFKCPSVVRREDFNIKRSKVDSPFAPPEYFSRDEQRIATVEFRSNSMYDHIERYTKRKLTYESDALNATLGILSAFDSGTRGSTWGLPVMRAANPYSTDDCSEMIKPRSIRANFGISLAWQNSNVGWPEDSGDCRPQRRASFPSWSWTAVTGPKTFNRPELTVQPDLQMNAALEHEDGKLISLEEHLALPVHSLPQLSRFIHLTG